MANNIANVNSAMGFTQAATLLNSIVSQATGKTALAATSTAEFVSQAQTALLTGSDALLGAISQVLSKTIFSIRPYNARFLGLQRDAVQWGNHVRKINFGSGDVENLDKYDLTDGASVDQQVVKKPDVLQTNFYSENAYQDHFTVFDDQLRMSFSSVDDFSRFISGIVTEVTNKLEQYRESWARLAMCNLIGATYNMGRVRHLLTEYAAFAGLEGTTDILSDHMDDFTKWLFSELRVLSDRFTERSMLYHTSPTGHNIYRHTPKEYQRLYIYSPFLAQVDARVLSAVFNPGYLNIGEREEVSFWQSLSTPDTISVTPSQITAAGAYAKGSAVANKKVLAVLMDYEAAGTTQVNEYMAPAPKNARGRYQTTWYGAEFRAWNDCTENCVVLCLD